MRRTVIYYDKYSDPISLELDGDVLEVRVQEESSGEEFPQRVYLNRDTVLSLSKELHEIAMRMKD